MKKLFFIALSFSVLANAAQTWHEFAQQNPCSAMIVKAYILNNHTDKVSISANTKTYPVVDTEKTSFTPVVQLTTTISKKQAIDYSKNPLLLAAQDRKYNVPYTVDNYTQCKAVLPRIYVNKDELVTCVTYIKPEMLDAAKQSLQ